MSDQHEQPAPRLPFSKFVSSMGVPDGGISCGIGFTIAWQRGSLTKVGRNGAFLLEILGACRDRLADYQSGAFACEENAEALTNLDRAIRVLELRLEPFGVRLRRRSDKGILGTHDVDPDAEGRPEPGGS